MNFTEEREGLLKKLEVTNDLMDKIISLDNNNYILNLEVEKRVKKLRELNGIYFDKLKKNSFEIAIVGLEKAGKSTFANALIENDVLPSAPERCTFTSTRLEYSTSDKAVIKFYNKDAFNDIFVSMLKDLEYPEAQKQYFEIMDIDEFKAYFDALEDKHPILYKNHQGKTNEEIIDILKWREGFILNGNEAVFEGDELNSENFKEFIKGRDVKKYDKDTKIEIKEDTDTSKPRSVKSIIIHSSKLAKLKNATIFDVPGFDSPTEIHERQTIERLKKADAIIMVVNIADKPNITSPQLKVLSRESDSDGIKLNEKLFLFGNQMDKIQGEATKKDDIIEVKNKKVEITRRKLQNIVIKEVSEKYQIAEPERVFFGSAKAFLGQKKLIESHSEYKDIGVDSIRAELIKYYKNDRFKILTNKVEKNYSELFIILRKLLKENENLNEETFKNLKEKEKEARKIQERTSGIIRKQIKDELQQLKFELKKEIKSNLFFSKKLKELIDKDFILIKENLINDAEININDSLGSEVRITRLNYYVRDILHKDFLEKFTKIILDVTDEKSLEIQERLSKSFVDALGAGEGNPHYKDIIEVTNSFISKVTLHISHNKEKFIYLIERFSRDIFDVLMLNPLGTEDRINKFLEEEIDFYLLDKYYKADLSLINVIITQHNEKLISTPNLTPKNINPTKVGNLFSNIIKNAEKLNSYVQEQKDTEYSDFVSDAETSLNILKASCHSIKDELNDIIEVPQKEDKKERSEYLDIEKLALGVRQSKNRAEVMSEINKDIENLKIVLEEAIIKAIALDKTFLTSIDKQIKFLINSTQVGAESDEAIKFNDFISDNIKKIKYNEYTNIEMKKEEYKRKIAILEEINEFLEKNE